MLFLSECANFRLSEHLEIDRSEERTESAVASWRVHVVVGGADVAVAARCPSLIFRMVFILYVVLVNTAGEWIYRR